MSRKLQESTTVADLLNRIPPSEKLSAAGESRTEIEKRKDLNWYKEIFGGADIAQLIGVIVYLIQILKNEDRLAALKVMEMMTDLIEKEMVSEFISKIKKGIHR